MIVVIVTHQSQLSSLRRNVYFLRKEQPSVNRALPPVGWHLCSVLAPASLLFQRRTLDLQDLRAALADDDCVGVREDGGDGEASGALDVHEEGAGSGHEGLELVLVGLTACLLVGIRDDGVEDGVRTRPGWG